MEKSKTDIIVSVVQFAGKGFKNCCVGLTSKVDAKLSEKNNVSEGDEFLFEIAPSIEIARELETKFIKMGMNKADIESDKNSKIIFIHKMIPVESR